MHIKQEKQEYMKSSFNINESLISTKREGIIETHQLSITDSIVKSGLPRSRNPWYSYFRHQSPYQMYLLDLHYMYENCQISRLHMFIPVGQ